jgi:hypothetical protein
MMPIEIPRFPLPDASRPRGRDMKSIAVLGVLALGCAACAAGPGLALEYNYNASTCVQLQEEAALVSVEAVTATGGQDRRIVRADPKAMLTVPWPDVSGSSAPDAVSLKERMEAIEKTSRGKSCAIRFQRTTGAAPSTLAPSR